MDRPERRSLDQEIQQIAEARRHHGIGQDQRVVTSRDPEVAGWRDELTVETPFTGFERWLLPFVFERGSCSIVVAAPNQVAPEHAHSDHALHVV